LAGFRAESTTVRVLTRYPWGYDPEFMALMPAALAVAPEDIAAGDVWIATGADGQIAAALGLPVNRHRRFAKRARGIGLGLSCRQVTIV
jgi:hypothetical protein